MVTGIKMLSKILLSESAADNMAELEKLSKVTQPGFLKSYLDGVLPDLLDLGVRILIAVVIYFIGIKLIKWLRKLTRRALERSNSDEGVKQFLDSCLKIVLYFVLIMFVVNQLGVETASIVAVLGSAGLALGLALQGSLSNFAGGVLILMFKPFKVGDYIIEDTHKNEGTVSEIMIFYTKLVSVDNKTIVIPNGVLANSSLTNVTQQDMRRLDLFVGISYHADIKLAKEILSELLIADQSRVQEEEMAVFVDSLQESSVRMGCRIWVKAEEYWAAKWRLTEEIKEQFDKKKIEIPFNQLAVSLTHKETKHL